jgi:hypothetical protein
MKFLTALILASLAAIGYSDDHGDGAGSATMVTPDALGGFTVSGRITNGGPLHAATGGGDMDVFRFADLPPGFVYRFTATDVSENFDGLLFQLREVHGPDSLIAATQGYPTTTAPAGYRATMDVEFTLEYLSVVYFKVYSPNDRQRYTLQGTLTATPIAAQ